MQSGTDVQDDAAVILQTVQNAAHMLLDQLTKKHGTHNTKQKLVLIYRPGRNERILWPKQLLWVNFSVRNKIQNFSEPRVS